MQNCAFIFTFYIIINFKIDNIVQQYLNLTFRQGRRLDVRHIAHFIPQH